jgi:hypothetical protein
LQSWDWKPQSTSIRWWSQFGIAKLVNIKLQFHYGFCWWYIYIYLSLYIYIYNERFISYTYIDISIVNGVYKPIYNVLGGTTLQGLNKPWKPTWRLTMKLWSAATEARTNGDLRKPPKSSGIHRYQKRAY